MSRKADNLDPQLQEVEAIRDARTVPESHAVTPETAREQIEAVSAGMSDRIDAAVAEVQEFDIEGPDGALPVRAYVPEGEAPHPVVVFFHGGGFVYGSVDTHDNVCRALADRAEALVLSVDYRLAPEHSFPAALHDAYAAVEWASEFAGDISGDPDRLAVAGDSAGGNLAAGVCLLARDRAAGRARGTPGTAPTIDHQVLVYPWLDPAARFDYESYALREDERSSEWLFEKYASDPLDAGNAYFAPILASDFSDLPPATIQTAGFDPLRDEGFAYADRLESAGVDVSHVNYEAMNHAFVNLLGIVDRAHDAIDHAATDLAASFE
ncbi:MAG: alpha/beta hydrolase [Haloarculaceae archaeon]